MTTIKLKPRALTADQRAALPGTAAERTHVRVVNPADGRELPAHGADVPQTAYWMSRLRDGDVIRCVHLEQAPPADETKPKARSKRGSGSTNSAQEA